MKRNVNISCPSDLPHYEFYDDLILRFVWDPPITNRIQMAVAIEEWLIKGKAPEGAYCINHP
jgi:hypothetical protein